MESPEIIWMRGYTPFGKSRFINRFRGTLFSDKPIHTLRSLHLEVSIVMGVPPVIINFRIGLSMK